MIASPISICTATWWSRDHSISIEYSLPVLEEIRNLAVSGLHTLGHGGLEIGGVLYGLRENGKVCVLASRELMLEHAFGPAFVLSDKDSGVLTKILEPPPGLETVGWFRSHTRGGLELDEHDEAFFDRFSIETWHVALVLKPAVGGSA